LLIFETVGEMAGHVGQSLGSGDWLLVDQPMITAFGRVTGDMQWIHVDPERAAREMPDGRTVAHGCLTLSLSAQLSASIFDIRQKRRGLNYGYDRVRFLAPVKSGARIRMRQDLASFEPIAGGGRLGLTCTVEIEGEAKPALVASQIILVFG
jgi:acyl dehydratase